MKNILKKVNDLITDNWFLKMFISLVCGFFFITMGIILNDKNDVIFTILTIISLSYIIILLIVGMIHAFIINPIKNFKSIYGKIKNLLLKKNILSLLLKK